MSQHNSLKDAGETVAFLIYGAVTMALSLGAFLGLCKLFWMMR